MIVTVILLSLMSISIPGSFAMEDKLFHVVAYFLLMGWFEQLYRRPGHVVWFALLIALGAGLEVAQSFTPNRNADWADMAANTLGVCGAWALGASPLAGLLLWFERRVLRLAPREGGEVTD